MLLHKVPDDWCQLMQAPLLPPACIGERTGQAGLHSGPQCTLYFWERT